MGVGFEERARLSRNWDYPCIISFRTIRLIALRRANNMCEICGDLSGLVLHHIDGDARNNNIIYIIILCRRCHQRVHHDAQKEVEALAVVIAREVKYADMPLEALRGKTT